MIVELRPGPFVAILPSGRKPVRISTAKQLVKTMRGAKKSAISMVTSENLSAISTRRDQANCK